MQSTANCCNIREKWRVIDHLMTGAREHGRSILSSSPVYVGDLCISTPQVFPFCFYVAYFIQKQSNAVVNPIMSYAHYCHQWVGFKSVPGRVLIYIYHVVLLPRLFVR